ncbi:MAG: hypothetical protein A2600_07120 [Candidatus Lambdaproteobacteria bacterium RIFOXYD1_FULL_56_27]|uniref:Outer membrane protein beta-barrel domain-containing protein n=1 Tax=Candidatus Lambdaproteobacteria bacterium RIFOXYD2_FULL_56_26 TaxID=1817773 RepID=A0A1F6GQ89_9PROT|nr:MAG: hypothetical protein A2557_05780 [Candidatus Lambdaproteobacteria bacterium RIFOXYD2_FULL_56_26]OGH03702.1 MAG: hypothetical protein A2426_00570 [Candidatus Lambdaproteobacteria bacterium RIFOXYC1_FULL_56_13]OGH07286.1 MAG: hypothetical protein A2600_07120 [Candidatus Lambdaproteobacteria bacterium RIFOXYD1_FULL_56_27]
MGKIVGLGLLGFLLLAAPLKAEVWISASSPTAFVYSATPSSLYQFDQSSSVPAQGWAFLAKIPLLPAVGMSQFTLNVPPLQSVSTEYNRFTTTSYDVGLDFSGKSATFLLGYGVGKTEFTCTQTDCAGLSFKPLELHQYFVQLGVPFGSGSDFHFDLRRLIGRVQIDNGTLTETLHLQGVLAAFGLRLGF